MKCEYCKNIFVDDSEGVDQNHILMQCLECDKIGWIKANEMVSSSI